MKRTRSRIHALIVGLALLTCRVEAQGFKQPDETLPGFKAHGVYESQGIENLSLFNGDPQLAVPLGPEYPTGAGTSFRLTAHYSTRFWHMYEVECGTSVSCGKPTETRAHVRGLPTLGVGWTLELGSVDPSPNPNTPARYLSSDGGIHEFNEPAFNIPVFPHDDAEVRIERRAAGGYVVRQTDGTSLWLTHRYTRPPSRNNADFSDVDRKAIDRRTDRWGLSEIKDRFGNTTVRVNWIAEDPLQLNPPPDAWKISSIELQNPVRTIHLTWGVYKVENPWEVLESIRFPMLSSPETTLDVIFGYAPNGTFERTLFDFSPGDPCTDLAPRFVDLPFLTSIAQWTNAHIFEYSLQATLQNPATQHSTGLLTAFRLPTGARVEYAYADATAGVPCIRGIGCSSLDETLPAAVAQDSDPLLLCDRWRRIQRYLDSAPAVRSRIETDPTIVPTAPVQTTYAREQFAERLSPAPQTDPAGNYRDPARIVRRVIVKRRSGNGTAIHATRHLFHVLVEGQEGSAGGGVEVERRM